VGKKDPIHPSYYDWDGLDVIVERDSSGVITDRHIHGPAPVAGIGTRLVSYNYHDSIWPLPDLWYHRDAVGSTRILTKDDTPPTVGAKYDVNAWGAYTRSEGSEDTPFVFCGKERRTDTPDADLVYFGRRYYAPSLGRWLSRDPAKQKLNWYQYYSNDPMNRVDAEGLQAMPFGSPYIELPPDHHREHHQEIIDHFRRLPPAIVPTDEWSSSVPEFKTDPASNAKYFSELRAAAAELTKLNQALLPDLAAYYRDIVRQLKSMPNITGLAGELWNHWWCGGGDILDMDPGKVFRHAAARDVAAAAIALAGNSVRARLARHPTSTVHIKPMTTLSTPASRADRLDILRDVDFFASCGVLQAQAQASASPVKGEPGVYEVTVWYFVWDRFRWLPKTDLYAVDPYAPTLKARDEWAAALEGYKHEGGTVTAFDWQTKPLTYGYRVRVSAEGKVTEVR
jgi:RHS repeat-associated protein